MATPSEPYSSTGHHPATAPPLSPKLSARLVPLDLRDVLIEDSFWAPRRELVRRTTLPQQEQQLRAKGKQFDALRLQWRHGMEEPHIFWESDVGKWIEAASYTLACHPDPALEASVDEAIGLLAGAQGDDGYLNTYFTVVRPEGRFRDLRDAHELYCLGHLIEAAVAHHAATAKTSLLNIVCKYADLVDREFGPGGMCEGGYDGHQEIELALIKLSRSTREPRYLNLARRMIDARGTQPFYFEAEADRRGDEGYFSSVFPQRRDQGQHFREYNQSHLPVRQQSEIVGHAVRAMYMLCAMTDLAAADGDQDLLRVAECLWYSATETKMYVTGGLGSDPSIEGFGPAFDLPDADGYAETCAAIGLVMWAQRMVNLTGQGHYADTLERALYNGVLSGGSADGTCYFYGNPLASDGSLHRHEWFGVACCPPNLARLLSSLQTYAYGQSADELAIHLYIAGSARTIAGGGALVRLETEYPLNGTVRIVVEPDHEGTEWTLALRVPAWSRASSLRIGNETVDLATITEEGFARIRRRWSRGDVVEIDLEVSEFRVWANTDVSAVAGKVALQRGPVVYCFEGADHPGSTRDLVLPRSAQFAIEPEHVSGLVALTTVGYVDANPPGSHSLYRQKPPSHVAQSLRAVPYFAWANREQSSMNVWMRET